MPRPTSTIREPNALQRFGEAFAAHRILIAVLAGITLLLAIAFPFAIAYDAKIDRQRAGYNDAAAVVRMQTALMQENKPPVEFAITEGESQQIGAETFTAGEGNSVEVTTHDGGFCVRVVTSADDVEDWTYDSLDTEEEYEEQPGGACDQ
jgi:hypothetical protein